MAKKRNFHLAHLRARDNILLCNPQLNTISFSKAILIRLMGGSGDEESRYIDCMQPSYPNLVKDSSTIQLLTLLIKQARHRYLFAHTPHSNMLDVSSSSMLTLISTYLCNFNNGYTHRSKETFTFCNLGCTSSNGSFVKVQVVNQMYKCH